MVLEKCDICLHPKGLVKSFLTYQACTQEEEEHFVCEKCVHKLVEKYFSKTNVL